jgi:hypothetical protein
MKVLALTLAEYELVPVLEDQSKLCGMVLTHHPQHYLEGYGDQIPVHVIE